MLVKKKRKKKPIAPIDLIDFQLSSTTLTPSQLLVLTFKKHATAITEAKFGTSTVKLTALSDSSYTFVVPENTTPQTYEISFGEKYTKKQITIQKGEVIANPTTYIQQFLSKASSLLEQGKATEDSLIKYNIVSKSSVDAQRNQLSQQLSTASSKLSSATESEKKSTAQFLSANASLINSLLEASSSTQALSGLRTEATMADCPTSLTSEFSECMAEKLFERALLISAALTLIVTGPTVQPPLLGVILGSISLVYVSQTAKDLLHFCVLLHNLDPSSEPTLEVLPANEGKTFKNTSSRTVSYKYLLTNLYDNISPVNISSKKQALLNQIAIFKQKAKDLGMESLIGMGAVVRREGRKLPESVNNLVLSVLNNNKVTGLIENFKSGLFSVKFNTTETTKQQFDYKITYNFGDKKTEKIITENSLEPIGEDLYKDCTIQSIDGAPISSAGTVTTEYTFEIKGNSCQFPPKTLFSWNFGDGWSNVNVDNPRITHRYDKTGTFQVKLRILLDGASDYIYKEVNVTIGHEDPLNREYQSFYINGVKYEGTDTRYFSGLFVDSEFKYQPGAQYNGVTIIAKANIYVAIHSSHWKGVGVYPLQLFNKDYQSIGAGIVGYEGAVSNDATSYVSESGNLTVTQFDKNWFAGTFSFVARQKSGKTITITNGKFRMKFE